MLENFIEKTGLKRKSTDDIRLMHPLVLAYIGDGVYELFVRTYLLHKYDYSVKDLHKMSIQFVNATAQSEIVHALEMEWEDEEWQIIKRGRNQKSNSIPKNASLIDYKYATGFETLVGYLFLAGKTQRLIEIIYKAIEIVEGSDI